MALLPTTLGTRPRLAVELRPEGVVAARAEDAQAIVSAVSYGVFAEGTLTPGLKHGNFAVRAAVVAAVRKALEAVALKERRTTLVLPDATVRVLLLDFDALPTKPAEALPVVRFRLKKLLPFDADDAVVSYQIMSQTRDAIRVLAVAVPKEVLAEYEGVVREAGFEPGAVLPSTLAAIAGMAEIEAAALLVNAGETAVTTAIVQGGVLLLHRTVDLAAEGVGELVAAVAAAEHATPPLEIPVELLAGAPKPASRTAPAPLLPLVDPDDSAGEWAQQQPLSGYGVLDDEEISKARTRGRWGEDVQTALDWNDEEDAHAARLRAEIEAEALAEAHGVPEAELADAVAQDPAVELAVGVEEARLRAAAREVTQAVSVAAAYFEDTLQIPPGVVLAAGTMGAETLGGLLREAGFTAGELRVREMIDPSMLVGGAVSTRVPAGWMAGVRGALRS